MGVSSFWKCCFRIPIEQSASGCSKLFVVYASFPKHANILSSKFQRRKNKNIHRGNIRADMRAIIAKEIHPEVASRWKTVFLDRYGVHWEECMECDGLRMVSLEGIQLLHIRAYVSHRFQANRTVMLEDCDGWIARWKDDHAISVAPEIYRRLCQLYYES